MKRKTTQPSARRQRRANNVAKARAGKKISNSPVEFDPQVMVAKVAALENSMEQLVKTYNTNQEAMHKAFQMTDAHLWVLNRLARDIVSGTVLKLESGAVNMEGYYDLFNANQRLQAEQAKATKAAAAAEAEKQQAEAQASEEPEVFGGDTINAGA